MSEKRSSPNRWVAARAIGSGALILSSLLGCSRESSNYIDCIDNPGGSVAADIDASKVGQKIVLGDKRRHTYYSPEDKKHISYDDTFKVEILEAEGEVVLIASSNSGASPVGAGDTLDVIRQADRVTLISSSRSPNQEPPYFSLTAEAEDNSSIVHVTFSCDSNQTPPK